MVAKIHYLEMIQGIIDRMGSNSFMLKGWAITLAVGVFALSDKDSDKLFFLLFAVDLERDEFWTNQIDYTQDKENPYTAELYQFKMGFTDDLKR